MDTSIDLKKINKESDALIEKYREMYRINEELYVSTKKTFTCDIEFCDNIRVTQIEIKYYRALIPGVLEKPNVVVYFYLQGFYKKQSFKSFSSLECLIEYVNNCTLDNNILRTSYDEYFTHEDLKMTAYKFKSQSDIDQFKLICQKYREYIIV